MPTDTATAPGHEAAAPTAAPVPPRAAERPGWRLIAGSLRRRRGRLGVLAAWSGLEALPALLSGLLVSRAVDDGFLAGSTATGVVWLLALLAVHAAGAVGTRFTFPVVGAIVEPLRDDLLASVVRGVVHSGSERSFAPDSASISRITQQVETVRRSTAGLLSGLRRFVFTVSATAVGLAALSAEILWIALPPIVVSVGLFGLLLSRLVRRQHAAILANERVSGAVGDALSGSRDIAAYREQEGVVGEVTGVLLEERGAQQRLAGATALRSVVTAIGAHLPLLGLLAAAPWLLGQGMSVGVLLGAATYLSTTVEPAMRLLTEVVGGAGLQLAVTVRRLAEADPSAERPAAALSPAGRTPEGFRLRTRALRFSYGAASEPVVRDLDLDIAEGAHVAVVGPSGIGKSTLAGLLAGVLRPDSGSAEVGGTAAAGLADRPGTVTLIPQESYVFSGTLRDNLRYLRPEAADRELDAAVLAVGAGGTVERLGGFGADLDPAALSQGERQLIALVRAYTAQAPVTVLDEATCYLDPTAEATAEQAFRERRGTLVVIAHRLTSAMRADRVLLLDGTRASAGTHAELLASSRLYGDLVGRWGA